MAQFSSVLATPYIFSAQGRKITQRAESGRKNNFPPMRRKLLIRAESSQKKKIRILSPFKGVKRPIHT